jgi:hypothetical protein
VKGESTTTASSTLGSAGNDANSSSTKKSLGSEELKKPNDATASTSPVDPNKATGTFIPEDPSPQSPF